MSSAENGYRPGDMPWQVEVTLVAFAVIVSNLIGWWIL